MSSGKRSGNNGEANRLIVSLAMLVLIELVFVGAIFVFHVPVRKPVVLTSTGVPYESMMNLITWTQSNGYSSLQWNAITELSIFHVWPDANGSITYGAGGTPLNYNAIIATAHQHGVRVFLAFGGAGVNASIINNILANQTLQAIFINNLVTEMQNRGYDGLHVDFEGTFNRSQFTTFVKNLYTAAYARNPNVEIDVQVADWESSDFNLPALEPYTTHFNVMFNPTITDMNSWASQLQNPYKMAAGYDFQDDPETPTILLPKLQADRQANYGVFFWQASTANASYYAVIEQALGNLTSNTTTSTATTSTAATTSTSTSTAPTTTITTKSTASTSTTSTSTTITGSTTTIPAPEFTNGTAVTVRYPTVLWQTPTNAVTIGSEPTGANGLIIKNPVFDNYTQLWFYYTRFANGTGWVKEKQFYPSATTSTISSSTVSTTAPTTTASTSSSTAPTSSSTTSASTSTQTTSAPTSGSTSTSTTSSISSSTSIATTTSISTTSAPTTISLTTASTSTSTTSTSTTSSTSSPSTTQGTTSASTTSPTTSKATTTTVSLTTPSTTVVTSKTTTAPTTIAPTTTSLTVPTTTVPAITTSNSTVSANAMISANSPLTINLKSANSTINVTSNSPTRANVAISNLTGNSTIPRLPNNALLLALRINYTEAPASLLYTTLKTSYPCSVPSGSIYVSQLVSGTWSQIPYSVDSAKCSVTYNIITDPIIGIFVQSLSSTTTSTTATTTISSGGGGSSGSAGRLGSAGGGGSSKPVISATANGYIISNITRLNAVNVTLNGVQIRIIENYITPTSAGLTINNATYMMNTSSSYLIYSLSNYGIYAKLLNISYIPIEQTITLYVYTNSTAAATTAQTTSISTSTPTTSSTVSTAPTTSAAILPAITNIAAVAPPSKGFTNMLYLISGIIVAAVLTTVYLIYLRKVMGNIMLSRRHILAIYILTGAAVLLAGIFAYSVISHYQVIRPLVPSNNTTVTTTIQSTIPSGYNLVQFQEYGLPLGTRWYVQLGSSFKDGVLQQGIADTKIGTINSTTGYINFTVPSGMYYYTVKQVPGYNLVNYQFRDQGYVNVSPQGYHTITGMFVKCSTNCNSSTQTLSFQAFGLPAGTNWSVTVDGATNTSDSLFVNFTEPLGTHNYAISQANGHAAYPSNGTVNMTSNSSIYSVAAVFGGLLH